MTQCAAILAVLADGQPHTVAEIHRRAGYSRLNSRVSELRERGYVIACEHVEADTTVERYRYTLKASPPLTAAAGPAPPPPGNGPAQLNLLDAA